MAEPVYPECEFPVYRQSPPHPLSASELADAEREYTLRQEETRGLYRHYKRRGCEECAREMVTSLKRLEAERTQFFRSQDDLRLHAMPAAA
jgi:hypothetical protein